MNTSQEYTGFLDDFSDVMTNRYQEYRFSDDNEGLLNTQPTQDFGAYLRALREDANLSRQELADKVGLREADLVALENGCMNNIRTQWLHSLAAALKVDIEMVALLLEYDIPEPNLAPIPIGKGLWRAWCQNFASRREALIFAILMIVASLMTVILVWQAEKVLPLLSVITSYLPPNPLEINQISELELFSIAQQGLSITRKWPLILSIITLMLITMWWARWQFNPLRHTATNALALIRRYLYLLIPNRILVKMTLSIVLGLQLVVVVFLAINMPKSVSAAPSAIMDVSSHSISTTESTHNVIYFPLIVKNGETECELDHYRVLETPGVARGTERYYDDYKVLETHGKVRGFTNYHVEVEARWIDSESLGEEYGIVFGLTENTKSHYRFVVDTKNHNYRIQNVETTPQFNNFEVIDTEKTITLNDGDKNNNDNIDIGETWAFTATTNFTNKLHTDEVVYRPKLTIEKIGPISVHSNETIVYTFTISHKSGKDDVVYTDVIYIDNNLSNDLSVTKSSFKKQQPVDDNIGKYWISYRIEGDSKSETGEFEISVSDKRFRVPEPWLAGFIAQNTHTKNLIKAVEEKGVKDFITQAIYQPQSLSQEYFNGDSLLYVMGSIMYSILTQLLFIIMSLVLLRDGRLKIRLLKPPPEPSPPPEKSSSV